MHFNYNFFHKSFENLNNKIYLKIPEIEVVGPEKSEIFEPKCNQPVKHMVSQNLEANVLESRLKGIWKIVIIRILFVREIFYGRRRQTSKT